MKITWLGQAGLLFEADGKKILIDPYLSDSVKAINPKNYRRVAVDTRFLALRPDVIVITHCHLDHLDPETLKHYLTEDADCLVLAPDGSWQQIRTAFPHTGCNYVLFNDGTTWTEEGITFRAVKAEHSDAGAIGVILSAEGRNYYVTGDTLYSERVFDSLPDGSDIYAVFLPINGVGNNMNMADAARFAQRVGARYAVPMHVGLFDEINPAEFPAENKIVPTMYREIELP
jgi:L-ascorbate metabolism protein UlaG (beta-lactamase superfamily)